MKNFNQYSFPSHFNSKKVKKTVIFLSHFHSITPNGYILTEDPFFSPETFEAPYFKKDTGKKSKKKKPTIEEIEEPENIDWTERVQKVDITKYQTIDPAFYEKIVKQAFDLHATEKINPFVSQVWNLREVNKAIQFVNLKKCLGKVLIDTQRQTVQPHKK